MYGYTSYFVNKTLCIVLHIIHVYMYCVTIMDDALSYPFLLHHSHKNITFTMAQNAGMLTLQSLN